MSDPGFLADVLPILRAQAQAAAAQDPLQALCLAVDAGDDGALPILADRLEELDDPRAAGLRLLMTGCGGTGGQQSRPEPMNAISEAYGWRWKKPNRIRWKPHHVRDDVWRLMTGALARGERWCWYPTRSAAILALAAALAG